MVLVDELAPPVMVELWSMLVVLKAGVINNDDKFVELLLAEMIGVLFDESPRTGELGKVNGFGLGLLGLDFFNLSLT